MSKEAEATWERWIKEAKKEKESDQGEATWNGWIKEEEEKAKELEKRRKTPEYKKEREEEKMKEEKWDKEHLEKCKLDYKENILISSEEAMKLHWERLRTFGASMYKGQMLYLGEKGGIYSLSANGTRNYKY